MLTVNVWLIADDIFPFKSNHWKVVPVGYVPASSVIAEQLGAGATNTGAIKGASIVTLTVFEVPVQPLALATITE